MQRPLRGLGAAATGAPAARTATAGSAATPTRATATTAGSASATAGSASAAFATRAAPATTTAPATGAATLFAVLPLGRHIRGSFRRRGRNARGGLDAHEIGDGAPTPRGLGFERAQLTQALDGGEDCVERV